MTTSSGGTFDSYDGFEGVAVGGSPAGTGPFGWTTAGATTAVASPVHQGGRSVQQQNPTRLTGTFAALPKGVVGAWLRRTTANPGDDDIYLYRSGVLAAIVGLGGSGRLHYFDGAFRDTAVAWTPGAWYLVTAVVDTAQNRYDFAVFDAAGTVLVRVPNVAFATGAGGVTDALFYTSSAFTGTAFVDDVRLLRWTGTETTVSIGPQEGQGGTGPAPGAFGKSAPPTGATGQPLTLTLSWAASSDATSYQVCVDTSNNSTCDTTWTTTATLSAAVSGLSAGTTYYWQVRDRGQRRRVVEFHDARRAARQLREGAAGQWRHRGADHADADLGRKRRRGQLSVLRRHHQ